MKKLLVLILALWSLVPLTAGGTSGGSEDVYSFLSPEGLGSGTSVTSQTPVLGDQQNPAVSGDNQRITFDVDYMTLLSTNGSKSTGNFVNLGLSYPTRFGVFTGSGIFVSSNFADYVLPTTGGVNFSWAKDVYRDLSVGVGVRFKTGAYSGKALDMEAGLDLGLLQKMESLGPLLDFRWGMSLRGLGKGFANPTGTVLPGAPFTLALGSEFNLVKEKGFLFGLNQDLSFPYFQNFRFSLGGKLTLFDSLTLRTSVSADALELINTPSKARSFVPTLGIYYNFMTDLGENSALLGSLSEKYRKNEIKTSVAAGLARNNTLAVGGGLNIPLGVVDKTPPVIAVTYPSDQYLSPNNDGKKDSLLFPIQITDQRFVKGYTFSIYDASGTLVREIKNKDERPENEGLQNFVSRLLEVKSGIQVPDTFRWDGVSEQGQVVPDGQYSFKIKAVDDNLNQAETPAYKFFVDNTPPEVSYNPVAGPDLIFSPDGDGNRDNFEFNLNGSVEDSWNLQILDSFGNPVRKVSQPGKLAAWSWDGKNDAGQSVPDGVYSFKVFATDRADNFVQANQPSLIVNTQVTPIVISLNYSDFSPNGDGIKDSIPLVSSIPVKEGIKSWALQILNKDNQVVRQVESTDGKLPPSPLDFDGKDNQGRILPEGDYRAKLIVSYFKGNNPSSISPTFNLDTTAPKASLALEGTAFSPDGDGNRDGMNIRQSGSAENLWTGEIFAPGEKQPLKTWTWAGKLDDVVAWDGLSDKGILQKDGDYQYSLRATDEAGNSFLAKSETFKLDTAKKDALLTADLKAFSPNGDSVKDKIKLTPRTTVTEGIQSYTISIVNAKGMAQRSFTGLSQLPEFSVWDGLSDSGQRVPEGNYHGELTVSYKSGATVAARTADFVLDITSPEVELSTPYLLFSPNGDGKKDKLVISHKTKKEIIWKANLVDATGKEIQTWTFNKKIPEVVWDGTDNSNNPVADGKFTYTVFGEDEAGNSAKASLGPIQLDSRVPKLFLTLDKAAFSPNKDQTATHLALQAIAEPKDGQSGWNLSILDSKGAAVKRLSGTGPLPARLTWDGQRDDGTLQDGVYTSLVKVFYAKGDEPEVRTNSFILDTTAPVARIKLSPELFSPDNDGFEDELNIGIEVQDLVGVDSWDLTIKDPEGNFFTSFSGTEKPAERIIWDGRSRSGELVQAATDYPFVLNVKDKLGQKSEVKGLVPIDVLVIRDGDRLKIQIPSITFPGNKAILLDDNSDASKKNKQVIERLAVILNRFAKHKIRIEGHAVNLSGTAKEEETDLKPLSLERAKAVRDALGKGGVDISRITVAGMGGTEPVVPHSDTSNRWKNRRVEFILVR